MKNKNLLKIAKCISADIRVHFECLGLGIDHNQYLTLRNKSDNAVQLARYLGENLAIEKSDKRYF